MNQVCIPEEAAIIQIERLALEARHIRRRIESAHTPQDRRVMNRQLQEIEAEIHQLQSRLER
ncbi:hypothetical protein [Humisphaera borealis]|uniref:Uncharacterized protein n=1 Tax=Humisphaera borealis TaxID=2807512 RepID=A0A7M2WQ52_9BACT|nr:hypothetical protein [Humisphaera borealis]QOV87384.1 hypothetical protein IPV69_13900 [Humisphaera borealis]